MRRRRQWGTVVDLRIALGHGVELLGDEAGDDGRADGGVVAGIVEEADGQRQERVAGDAVELGAEGGEILVAGGDGRDVDQHDAGTVGVAVLRYSPTTVRGKSPPALGLEKVAPGSQEVLGGEGGVKKPLWMVTVSSSGRWWVTWNQTSLMSGVDGEAGGVSGEGDGLLGVGEQHVAALGRVAVAQQLEHAFGVDGLAPGVAFGLEAVGGELDEEDARAGVVGEVAIRG